jgi:histone H3/H4
MQAINELDPNLATHTAADGTTSTGVEQLARLRSRLFRLKEEPMVDPDVYRNANDLWSTLTEIMDNPQGAQSAAFSESYAAARQIHRDMEETLRITQVKRLLRSNDVTPEQLARRYTNPNHFTELDTIKRIFTESDQVAGWNTFRELTVADILTSAEPQQALGRLDRFAAQDPRMLRLLMSEAEEESARAYLNTSIRIQTAPVQRALRQFNSDADRAMFLINESSPAELADIIQRSGGIDSDLAIAMRGAIYRNIGTRSRETHRIAGEVSDPSKVNAALNEWQKTGKLESIFSSKDMAMLRDLELYSLATGTSPDVGGPMAAGALRSSAIKSIYDPGRAVGVAQALFANDFTAYMLSRPVVKARYSPMPETLHRHLQETVLLSNLAIRSGMEEQEQMYVDPMLRQ